jgi:hypothetical protein
MSSSMRPPWSWAARPRQRRGLTGSRVSTSRRWCCRSVSPEETRSTTRSASPSRGRDQAAGGQRALDGVEIDPKLLEDRHASG